MKKVLLTLITLFTIGFGAKAQELYDGKTFYDSAHKKIKEVFHYHLRYSYSVNYKAGGDTVINIVPVEVKNGPAITYREDGTILCTGQYNLNNKTGEWLFYDAKGKTVVRKEKY